VEGLEHIIRSHAFFAGLDPRFVDLVCGCARNVRFEAGQFLFREGAAADEFYLIRAGHVALQVVAPGRPALMLQTIGVGEVVGVSWLIPPYRWQNDARALELTRAIAIDGACLRAKCESDHDLGYEMLKRVVALVIERLHATRLQLLDVYGGEA
jgi:CRP-like cAMP-binding protein